MLEGLQMIKYFRPASRESILKRLIKKISEGSTFSVKIVAVAIVKVDQPNP
jgi:hypothetical protein